MGMDSMTSESMNGSRAWAWAPAAASARVPMNATPRTSATPRCAEAARGAATFGGMVEGPNIKGEVAQSIKEEMATLERRAGRSAHQRSPAEQPPGARRAVLSDAPRRQIGDFRGQF